MINSKINQVNREEVIKLLDKSRDLVKLEDLFLFDLSPYYEEKKNNSFFFKQLEYIQDKNLINHNPKISFTSEQINIYDKIVENKRNIVSAPTSFGKTMLVKEYIYNYQPNKVVFIVPTNSLADELLDDFKNLFQNLNYTIFDSIKNLESIDEKSIFIGTQEKYYNLIKFYNNIDLFVIDEAYKLTDPIKGSREVILNRSLIDTIKNSNKIILLMPLVNSISGLDNLKFKILKSEYAPVAKNFYSVKNLNAKIKEDIKNDRNTNLIYFNSPTDLENFYLKNLKQIKLPVNLDYNWINRVEEDFHPDWLPIFAIKSGIGIHYGPMPKFIQRKVIDLFNNTILKNLLSTNSIIEGVNTPTKNIYITTSRDILGDKNLVKYKNLIGRAGRLGKHKVGNIFYHERNKIKFEKANIPFEGINIEFKIDKLSEVIEINREEEYNATLNYDNQEESSKNYKTYLEHSNYKNVPTNEISVLLDKHGFTLNQLKIFLDYVENDKIIFLGIIGKIYRNVDIKCLNVVLNHRYMKFEQMVEKLYLQNEKVEKSKIISSLIDMIYSVLPFKIISLINFIIDINDLYKVHNRTGLLSDEIIKEAKTKKAQFYSKFIGVQDPNHESLVIVNKLFEYGMPYQRVKPHLKRLTDKLPNKFSIHDIKKIIFEDDIMIDLRVYFE